MSDTTIKTVVVTGASSGIGRATVLRLAERGHQVFAIARRTDALDRLVDEAGQRVIALGCDVRDEDQVTAMASAVASASGRAGPDVVVNAAGFAALGPVEAFSDSAARAQFDTNVFGLLHVTRAFLPAMRERRTGRIINVSSVVGRESMPMMGVYSASKFALEALSDALRIELAPFNIQVVLIEPGFVRTDIHHAAAAFATDYPLATPAYHASTARALETLTHNITTGIAPTRVAATITTAIHASKPAARYPVSTQNRLLLRLLAALPTRLADRAKAKVAGITGDDMLELNGHPS